MCERCNALGAETVHVWKRRDVIRALGASGLALAASACATNAELGREQFIIIDEASLQQASLQAWAQQRQQTPLWNNRAAQQRLERVGMRVAQGAGRGNQQWEFALFDTPEKNAFVLPGNKVGFYRGLYEICVNDDYMATVLGHETGHVSARHAAERYSQQTAAQVGLQVAGARINSELAMAALGLGAQVGVLLPFSRQQESEADRLGLNYMHAASFDVKQAIPFWNAMASGGGSRPPQLLSTHPDPQARIADIRAYINAQGWGPV